MPKHHAQMESVNLTLENITLEIGGGGATESINKTIIAYDIVKSSKRGFPQDLISLVNLKINEGWSPLGGLMYDGGYEVYQAIVKYD
jgi:hypothetical protein